LRVKNKINALFIVIVLFVVFIIKCDKETVVNPESGYYHIRNSKIDMLIDTSGVNGIVYKKGADNVTRCVGGKAAFSIISGKKEIEFKVQKVTVNEDSLFCGRAKRYDIFAEAVNQEGLLMHISISAPVRYENVLISRLQIVNNSNSTVVIDTLISHRYTLQAQPGDVLEDEPPFWAFCGGNYKERFDWIEPMKDGFYRGNSMSPIGGNPYTGVWNPQFAIGIMSLETKEGNLSFPVRREADGKLTIFIKETADEKLKSGEKWESELQALLIHEGDVYNGLKTWSQLLQNRGLRFQKSSKSCYESIWCGWGYEDDYTSDELLSTLPVAREMGIKWAVVDAGWYDRNTFWGLHKGKYPKGDSSMRAFTDSVKALGMRPKLWYIPATAPYGWPEGRWGKKGPLSVPDEKMLLLDKNGNTIDLKWFGVSLLCPAEKKVIEINKAFIRKAMKEWGVEGFKIDGDYLNRFPECYNPEHHHKTPMESVYGGVKLYKAMYDEAVSIVPDAVFEICACGTNYSIYNMQAQNQTVSSDPLSSWQIRHRGKIYHALLGSKVAYYGDHVELSDGKNDFASTIGIGGVPGTKFTLIETRKMEEGSKLLTPENKEVWTKYFKAYEKEKPSEGVYLNLYDIAYDKPEIHLLKKGKTLYYGLFSDGKYIGEVTLKGLDDDLKYDVEDYINNKVLYNNIDSRNNKIKVEFNRSLLIKVQPK
jgi:alpha-galactosidase